jgi:hypothetical protein
MNSERNASPYRHEDQSIPENYPYDNGLHILARIIARRIMAKRSSLSGMNSKDRKSQFRKDNENLS